MRGENISTGVRWFFLLFIFTFPLELADLTFITGSSHSVTKFVGFAFFAVYFCSLRPLPPIPSAVRWFMGYIVFYMLKGLFISSDEFLDAFFQRFFSLVQLLVFFWIASDLLKNEKMANGILVTYAIASATLALGILLRVPGFYAESLGGRITGLRENPNTLATHMAIAMAILIGLYLKTVYKHFMSRILFLVLPLPLLMVIVTTGSRGGVASFVSGCLIYLLPHWRSKRPLTAITLAILSIGVTVYMVANDPLFLSRWEESYHEGNLAQRERIFPVALEMFRERPVFGWQPLEFQYELGRRRGERILDTHNLLLHVLLEVGIVGTMPFVVGFWLCGRAAWRARCGHLGLLPLALLSIIIVSAMSSNIVIWKPQWLVLALTLAAASTIDTGQARPVGRFVLVRTT